MSFFSNIRWALPAGLVSVVVGVNAQDTSKSKMLDSVTVSGYMNQLKQYTLPPVQGTYIFSAKKTELINLNFNQASITEKNARQIFAKVPGVFVYDMDGTGNQVNIAARGLDPHRGWEFNTRKDGVITNSDMYGYPASHFSMPLESIERIELVRGTGSLQYGAQFGGMLNYVSKQGDTSRPFSFESINSAGSFNLVSTFNAVGGKLGSFNYYAYASKKLRDGYRDNEHTKSEAQSISIAYQPIQKFSVQLSWTRSSYLYRMAGQLTDQQFRENPRQASRTRNYFNPDIHIPAITLRWQVSQTTRIQLVTSAVLGRRNSVMFDKPANIKDTINASTMQYSNRQVDIDRFNSYTTELRILHQYPFFKKIHTVASGVQYMNNDLRRTQLGKGTTGSDYDLSLVEPGWGRNVHLRTQNIAVFAENIFQLSSTLSITLGMRMEMGRTNMSGEIVYYPNAQIPLRLDRKFPLFGAGISYKPAKNMEMYGAWSQAYHPMLFKDLIPGSLLEKVDPKIKDANGYNAEIGFRGNWQFLRWDISAFLLQLNNRFGNLAQTDQSGNFYTYRTNVGNSLTKGLELFVQADWVLKDELVLSIFNSTAFIDARYRNGVIKSGANNINISGNKVETAPNSISRTGINIRFDKLSLSSLLSYTASSFSDALNTVEPPPATGAVGLVPAYCLLDMHASYRLNRSLEFKLNVNNIMDKQYFTKRPAFYPGPGIWPSDGRSFNVIFSIRL